MRRALANEHGRNPLAVQPPAVSSSPRPRPRPLSGAPVDPSVVKQGPEFGGPPSPPPPTKTSHSAFQRPQHKRSLLHLASSATQTMKSHVRPRLSPMAHVTTSRPELSARRRLLLLCLWPARIMGPHTAHQPGAARTHSLTPHLDQVPVSPRGHPSALLGIRGCLSHSHANPRHARDARGALPGPGLCNASAGPACL